MRILHILDHSIPLHSGYAFRTCAIIEHQQKLGWETYHITSSKHSISSKLEECVEDLHFYRTPQTPGLLAKIPVFNQIAVINSLVKRINQVVTEIQPDILHAHSPALNGVAALRIGQRYKIPVVYEVRAFWEDAAVDHGTARAWGLRYRFTRAMETYVLKRSKMITTICEGLRRDIVARGIEHQKIIVIPNAVDVDKFTYNGRPDPALSKKFGIDGMFVLGFIGSFYAYEGLHLLLQALPSILVRLPNIRVLLVGGGPQESYLRNLADDLDIRDFIIFTGRIPHDEIQRYYNLVDLFVYPRLSMRLTELVTPLKPLEAMAQKRLILASDVGGHREIITQDITGKMFTAGNFTDLADCVVKLMENKDTWPRMRSDARRFVELERNWSVSVSGYGRVYGAAADSLKTT